MKRSEADARALAAIDRLGHVTIVDPDHGAYALTGSKEVTLGAVERLCRAGVLRAETFTDGYGATRAWVQRPERFVLPAWAKYRGARLWAPVNSED
jgi:hypothetical protein